MTYDSILDRVGIPFGVARNGNNLFSSAGQDGCEESSGRRFVGFMPGTDIRKGDILVNPSNERYIVVDVRTKFVRQAPFCLMAFYETEAEHHAQQSTAVYNIGAAYGSIIGTGNIATLNYNASLNQLKERIEQDVSPDKEELGRIVDILELILEERLPVKRGLFSKFSGVMERNSWISSAVASTLLNWLLTQTP